MATLLSRLRPCISVRLIASRVFSSPSFKPHNSLSSSSFSRPFLNPRAFVGYPIKDKDADAGGGGGVSRASIKADAYAGGGGVSRAPIKEAGDGGGVSRAPIKLGDAFRTFTRLRGLLAEKEKTGASWGLSVSDDTDDTKTELYQVYMGERQPDDYDTDEIASHIDLLALLLGSEEAARESIQYSYSRKISGFGAMLTALHAKRLAEFPNVVSVDRCRCFVPVC